MPRALTIASRHEVSVRLSLLDIWARHSRQLPVNDIRRIRMVPGRTLEGWINDYKRWFESNDRLWAAIWDEAVKAVPRSIFVKIEEEDLYTAYLASRAAVIGVELANVQAETIGLVLANPELRSWQETQYALKESIGLHPRNYKAFISQSAAIRERFKDDPNRAEREVERLYNRKKNYRAQLIARTEMMTAINNAQLQAAMKAESEGRTVGPTMKLWSNVGDDRVSDGCQTNSNDNWIPIGQAFWSGHDAPPRFPGCRCTLMYRSQRSVDKRGLTSGPSQSELERRQGEGLA
jgi:hypothetical protein